MPQTLIGIDPGLKGAVGVIGQDGRMQAVWDLPVLDTRRSTRRVQIDPEVLHAIMAMLTRYPEPVVRVEWPTTRPGESPEAGKNFGIGLGQLEAFCIACGLRMDKVAPSRWKGDLGLPGKKKDREASRLACEFCAQWVEGVARDVVFGPRGGPRDGRAEALLIAWHGWSRTYEGMRFVERRFGRDSDEAMAFILMGGRRGRKASRRMPI